MHDFHLTDTRRQQMDHSGARPAHESRRFPGHDQRMSDHTRRIRSAACGCGSGKAYGDCCMDNDHQQSSARPSYSLPESVRRNPAIRDRIEDHLRIGAFSAFYKAGHHEHNLIVRFARALVASAGPIRDERQVRRWHDRFCKRPSRRLQEVQA